jgi:hypothetical protein
MLGKTASDPDPDLPGDLPDVPSGACGHLADRHGVPGFFQGQNSPSGPAPGRLVKGGLAAGG